MDFHLKSILQSPCSHIRDPSDVINKIKSFKNIRSNLILVKADIVCLHPIIPHKLNFNAIKEALGNKERKSLRIITLNLMEKLNNSYQVQLLGLLNRHHHMHLYSWI